MPKRQSSRSASDLENAPAPKIPRSVPNGTVTPSNVNAGAASTAADTTTKSVARPTKSNAAPTKSNAAPTSSNDAPTSSNDAPTSFNDAGHTRRRGAVNQRFPKKTDLERECKRRGLSQQGLKPVLVDRILKHQYQILGAAAAAKRVNKIKMEKLVGPVAVTDAEKKREQQLYNISRKNPVISECRIRDLGEEGTKRVLVSRIILYERYLNAQNTGASKAAVGDGKDEYAGDAENEEDEEGDDEEEEEEEEDEEDVEDAEDANVMVIDKSQKDQDKSGNKNAKKAKPQSKGHKATNGISSRSVDAGSEIGHLLGQLFEQLMQCSLAELRARCQSLNINWNGGQCELAGRLLDLEQQQKFTASHVPREPVSSVNSPLPQTVDDQGWDYIDDEENVKHDWADVDHDQQDVRHLLHPGEKFLLPHGRYIFRENDPIFAVPSAMIRDNQRHHVTHRELRDKRPRATWWQYHDLEDCDECSEELSV